MNNSRRRRKEKELQRQSQALARQKHYLDAREAAIETSSENRAPVVRTEEVNHLRVYQHQGPLPDPRTLFGYGAAGPDFPERIMRMAESEQAHRHRRDLVVIGGRLNQEKLGTSAALIVSLFGLTVAAYVTVHGFPATGAIIGGADLVALAGLFIYGRSRNERKQEAAKGDARPPDKASPQSPERPAETTPSEVTPAPNS